MLRASSRKITLKKKRQGQRVGPDATVFRSLCITRNKTKPRCVSLSLLSHHRRIPSHFIDGRVPSHFIPSHFIHGHVPSHTSFTSCSCLPRPTRRVVAREEALTSHVIPLIPIMRYIEAYSGSCVLGREWRPPCHQVKDGDHSSSGRVSPLMYRPGFGVSEGF